MISNEKATAVFNLQELPNNKQAFVEVRGKEAEIVEMMAQCAKTHEQIAVLLLSATAVICTSGLYSVERFLKIVELYKK